MVFASTKSKEELEAAKKEKTSASLNRAASILEKVSRRRGMDEEIKVKLKEMVSWLRSSAEKHKA